MTVLMKKGEIQELILNGPVRMSFTVNSRRLLVDGYAPVQSQIASDLTTVTDGSWDYPSLDGSQQMVINIDDKRGRTVVPKFFINRKLNSSELSAALQKYNLQTEIVAPPAQEGQDSPATYYIRNIEIRLFDFGYGVVNITGQIKANRDLTGKEVDDAGTRIGQEVHNFNPLFGDTFQAVLNIMPGKYVEQDIARQAAFHATPEALAMRPRQENNKILWVHRVYMMKANTKEQYEILKETSKSLIPCANTDDVWDASLSEDMAVYPGVGNSVCAYNTATVSEHDAHLLPRVIAAQQMYFAKAEEYDYALFFFNNDLLISRETRTQAELEKLSDFVVEFQSRITLFKAVFEDYDNHLEPQSLKIWKMLFDSWDTLDRFRGVDNKLNALERIYDRVMQDIRNLQGKNLNMFVLLFTILSMLSVVVDTVDFTQGGELQSPAVARVALLTLMALILLIVGGRAVRKN